MHFAVEWQVPEPSRGKYDVLLITGSVSDRGFLVKAMASIFKLKENEYVQRQA